MEKEIYEPLQAWGYDVEPLDICILNELGKGASVTTLNEAIKNEYGIDYSRSEIVNRVEKLKSKGLLLAHGATFIADPSKLYNHLLLNLIKLPLRPLVPGAFKGWEKAQEEIKEVIGKRYKELSILMMFAPEGERTYDVCLFLCTNSLSKYYEFLEEVTEKGLVESSQTIKAHIPAGFHFNPFTVPSYEEFKNITRIFKEKLPRMKE